MREHSLLLANYILLVYYYLRVYDVPEMEPLVLPFAEGADRFGGGGGTGNMLAKPRCFSGGKEMEPERRPPPPVPAPEPDIFASRGGWQEAARSSVVGS